MTSDLKVFIRRTDRETEGQTTRWESLTLLQRRNDVGRWTLKVADFEDALALSPTVTSGAIVAPKGVIIRRGDVTLASGWCDGLPNVEMKGATLEWTFSGYDDMVYLADAMCWPKPTAAITAQTDDYDVRSGQVSTRVIGYFVANVATRQAISGATAGTNPLLGATGTTQARWDPLLELAQTLCGRTLNFYLKQRDSDNALKLDFAVPRNLVTEVQFSPEVGTVHSASFTSTAAKATRVIVGGGGEGAARVFRQYINTADETAWGGVRKPEQFRDRRDLDPAAVDFEAQMTKTGDEFLAENAGQVSFTIDATDAPGLQYGVNYLVGDLVRAYAPNTPIPVDDLVEEVEITYDPSGGERAKVTIGRPSDSAAQTEKTRREMRRRLSALEARQ